jgi:hypothetical protein
LGGRRGWTFDVAVAVAGTEPGWKKIQLIFVIDSENCWGLLLLITNPLRKCLTAKNPSAAFNFPPTLIKSPLLIYARNFIDHFNNAKHFLYKFPCLCFNKSIFIRTFC